jgi:hypothetical protein
LQKIENFTPDGLEIHNLTVVWKAIAAPIGNQVSGRASLLGINQASCSSSGDIGRESLMKLNRTIGYFSLAACVAVLSTASSASAGIISQWTFETSQPLTAGPFTAENGTAPGQALGSHAGASAYSTPAGNGSAHSFSSNIWAVGDYYQFKASTLGESSIGLLFDQTSSATGPRDFKVQYSTDGSTFADAGYSYTVNVNGAPNTAWNATTSSNVFTNFVDLSSNSALWNQATVYFRMINTSTTSANGGTTATAGTDRIDNVSILSNAPEPGSLLLFVLGTVCLGAFRRTIR